VKKTRLLKTSFRKCFFPFSIILVATQEHEIFLSSTFSAFKTDFPEVSEIEKQFISELNAIYFDVIISHDPKESIFKSEAR
jgi:hypothetical protein